MLSVHSPSPYSMSPSMHYAGAHSWQSWRAHELVNHLPTPPSSVPQRNTKHSVYQPQVLVQQQEDRLTLPPISSLEKHWSCSSPITPPDDEMLPSSRWAESKAGPSRLPSPLTADVSPIIESPSPSPSEYDDDTMEQDDYEEHEEDVDDPLSPSVHAADWVTSDQKRSAHFIAEKTCEMVCYLWFSTNISSSKSATRRRSRNARRTGQSYTPASTTSLSSLCNDSTAALQFSASPAFVQFMQKLLETTQVSQSVIVLSLHYIFRLKEKNNNVTEGMAGSEFRVAVVALMLANKFLDDNTYTNKTWCEVSGIALEELNKMEREFLAGVDFTLYVDKATYETWLNLLTGLIIAKERECLSWQSRRRRALYGPPQGEQPSNDYRYSISHEPRSRNYDAYRAQRARSSSPTRHRVSYHAYPNYSFTFSVPTNAQHVSPDSAVEPQTVSWENHDHVQRPCSKRSAADAFSPTSATLSNIPTKRPTGLALDIPAATAAVNSRQGASAHSAYEHFPDNINSLERLSLDASASSVPITPVEHDGQMYSAVPVAHPIPVRHLVASYRAEDAQRQPVPETLYFYTLASSPMRSQHYCEGDVSEALEPLEVSERKAKLRYSRPPPQAGQVYCPPQYAQSQMHHAYPVVPSNATSITPLSSTSSSASSVQHQNRSGHSLPPLAYALSALPSTRVPGVISPRLAQSAHTSPLPRFADVYGTMPPAHMTSTGMAYPAGGGAYSQYSHHAPVHAHYKPSIPSPLSKQNSGEYPAYSQENQDSRLYAERSPPSNVAVPAPFANAGPAGVSHFYSLQHAQNSFSSQCHSVSASPNAYAFAARGRRY